MLIKIHNEDSFYDQSKAKECWQYAIKEEHLNLSQFSLFLFLANNADKTIIDLNYKTFEDATGFKKTSYFRAIRTLKSKGYLIQTSEHRFDFYMKPFLINGIIPEYMFSEE